MLSVFGAVAICVIGVVATPSGGVATAIGGVRAALHRGSEPVLAPVRRKLPPCTWVGLPWTSR